MTAAPSPDPLITVITARAALQDAITAALQAGRSIQAVQAVTGLTRTQVRGEDYGSVPDRPTDPYRVQRGQRLQKALEECATGPEGAPVLRILNAFRRLVPRGSQHAAYNTFELALDYALSCTPESSRLTLVSGPPDTPARWFRYTPPGAELSRYTLTPKDPAPADLNPSRRMTMEERLAAHEAEFGTD